MDCIINPKSGRAVKKTSVLGKKLMKNPDKTLKEDCIINPKSGRAVRKDSVLGKKILAGMKPLRQKTTNFDDIEARTHSPSREAPSSPKPKTPPKPKKIRKPRVARPKTPPPPPKPKTPPPPLQQITEEVEEEIIIPPPPKERTEVPTLVSQEKKRIRTLKQFGPTCWFNSILMNILYSDANRALLLTKYKEWDCDNKIYNTLREILLNKYLKKETDTIEYDDFNDIRPENVLKELYEHDKKRFDFNPDENKGGYSSFLYVKKFYELLGVKVIFFDCYIPNADKKNKNPILFVSKFIHSNISWWKPNSKMKGHMNMKDALPRKEIKEMLKEDFEVILIHPLSHKPFPFEYPTQYYVPLSSKYGKMVQQMIKTPEKVNVGKNNFIMDTVNISSVRNEKVSMGHSIAGLTTQGKKVVYNGWTRMYSSQKFATNNSGKALKIPCEVIPYEWDVKKDEKFRLGLDCNLTFNKDYDPKTDYYLGEAGEEANELQFSFGESSSRILYYVKDVKNLKNIPKAEPEPRPIPPEKSKSKTIFITEAVSENKYSLDKRITLYNKAKIYLDKISEKECITRVKSGSKELMTLSNMLFMDKKIGTESAYGAIYLSSIKNVRDLLVVSKITPTTQDNLTEIIIMEKLTEKLVKTKQTKHFPLLYTSHICPDKKEKLALVSVNELCNGDLKMLVEDPSYEDMKPETIVNIMYQMLISLTTFNYFGYKHNDTHWGNFLYQNNTEEGYYEYEYKGQSFYIPSCPYNIMLYDFGLSKKLKNPNDKECYMEFVRPLSAFQPSYISGYVGWNSKTEKRDINELIDKIQSDLMNLSYFGGKNTKDVFLVILSILKKYFGDMVYKTTLKGSDIILNDKPFKIA